MSTCPHQILRHDLGCRLRDVANRHAACEAAFGFAGCWTGEAVCTHSKSARRQRRGEAHLLVLRSGLANLSDDLFLLHLQLAALPLEVADRPVDLALVLLQLLCRSDRLGEEESHSRLAPPCSSTYPSVLCSLASVLIARAGSR